MMLRVVMSAGLAWLGAAMLMITAAQAAGAGQKAETPPACGAADFEALRPTLLQQASRPLVATTAILPEGQDNQLIIVGPFGGPNDVDGYQFRVFLAKQRSGVADLTVDASGELVPSQVRHPDPATAKSIGVADPTSAFSLLVGIPEDTSGYAWARQSYLVVACRGDRVAAWGTHTFEESASLPTGLIAGALMVILYLLCATVVYLARVRLVGDPAEVKPPLRIATVKPWSWLRCLDPVVMTSDGFDRGSLSNLQVLFFVELVGFGLTDLALRTGVLSDLSQAIVYLLGIPALGTLGAQAASVTRDRISAENWAWLVNRGVLPVNDPGKVAPRWSDLITTEAVLDLPKLQALTFSLIVGIAMVAQGLQNFASFQVPTTLLQILGLSQIVFVGGRLTKPTNLGDLDNMLTDLKARTQELTRAALTGIDVDADGRPLRGRGAPGAPFRSLAAAQGASAVPNAAQRYSDLAGEVAVLLQSLSHRAVDTAPLNDPLDPTGEKQMDKDDAVTAAVLDAIENDGRPTADPNKALNALQPPYSDVVLRNTLASIQGALNQGHPSYKFAFEDTDIAGLLTGTINDLIAFVLGRTA